MTSPQFAATRDMNADGRAFMVGNGPGLPSGGTLVLTFDNLPHHSRWPRFAVVPTTGPRSSAGAAPHWMVGAPPAQGRAARAPLPGERSLLDLVIACGIGTDAQAAVRAIRAGAQE